MAEEYRGPYGITQRPKRKIGEIGQGILGGIETGGDFLQYLTNPRSGLPKDVSDFVIDYLASPSEYQKQILELEKEKRENRPDFVPYDYEPGTIVSSNPFLPSKGGRDAVLADNFRAKEAANLAAPLISETPSDFNTALLDEITQNIADLNAQSEPKQISALDFRKQEAERAGIDFKTGKPKGLGEADIQKTLESAFISALQDTEKSRGDKPPKGESKEDALARYKKEFEEATGIDASGKVDKSRALMAFGLALMQNKAGKGFNVGKMLQSVGEAGEAAMPQLDKAISRAEAAKLAAGKYALNQVEADENAAAAIRASHLEHIRAKDLEFFKAKLEAQEKSTEAPETKHPFTQKYTVGATPLEMQLLSAVEMNEKTGVSELVTKFQSPESQSTEVLNRYKNAAAGFGLAEELKVVLNTLDQVSAENGGQVFELLKGRGKNLISVLGLTSDNVLYDDATYDYLVEQGQKELAEKYRANPTSLENKAQVAQDALMARFKRFMTQETGNGISVYDSESAKVLTGKINLFTPLNKNLEYIGQLQNLFGHSLDTLDDLIIDLYDRDFYLSQGAYDKTLKKLNEGMKDVYEPLQLSAASDLTKKLYDVRD